MYSLTKHSEIFAGHEDQQVSIFGGPSQISLVRDMRTCIIILKTVFLVL